MQPAFQDGEAGELGFRRTTIAEAHEQAATTVRQQLAGCRLDPDCPAVVQDASQVATAVDDPAFSIVDFDHGSTSFPCSEMGFLHLRALGPALGSFLLGQCAGRPAEEDVHEAGPAEALTTPSCLAATAFTGVARRTDGHGDSPFCRRIS